MVALGRLCFSCFTGASGAVASVPFMPCFHLAYVVGPGITLPFPAFIRWKVEVCGSAGGCAVGDAGGVSAADDAGDEGAGGGAGAFVSILTLMQSYMGRPSLKSTGTFVVVLVVVLCACWAIVCSIEMALMDLGWLMMRMVEFLSSRLKKCSPLMSKSACLYGFLPLGRILKPLSKICFMLMMFWVTSGQ